MTPVNVYGNLQIFTIFVKVLKIHKILLLNPRTFLLLLYNIQREDAY